MPKALPPARRAPTPRRSAGSNRVRIIGGEWRGRIVRFPPVEGLRPTPDRVRETVFNWLGQDLHGLRCLDLFAGSGAFGLESLSRGAGEVVLVDRSRAVCDALHAAVRTLDASGARIVCADALEFAARAPGPFDVVFVDPPYGTGLADRSLALVPHLLAPGSRVYVESDRGLALDPRWSCRREGRAGAVRFQLIEWSGHDESHLSRHV